MERLPILLIALLIAAASADTLSDLRALQPLQKRHFSEGLLPSAFATSATYTTVKPEIYEFARLTHSLCLRLDASDEQVKAACAAAKSINDWRPAVACQLAVQFGINPGTFSFARDPGNQIGVFKAALARIKAAAAPTPIDTVLIDSEWTTLPAGDMTATADMASQHVKLRAGILGVLPGAALCWYECGGVQPIATGCGWRVSKSTVGNEGGFGCSLYTPGDLGLTLETFRRTVDNARLHTDKPAVMVYWSPGCGYKPGTGWSFEWDYPAYNSWHLGQLVNLSAFSDRGDYEDRFGPWWACGGLTFYPAPGDTRAPYYWRHVIAYVQGANGLGFDKVRP